MDDRPYFNETNEAAVKVISALVRDELIEDVMPGLGETVCFFSLKDEKLFTPTKTLYKLSIEKWRG